MATSRTIQKPSGIWYERGNGIGGTVVDGYLETSSPWINFGASSDTDAILARGVKSSNRVSYPNRGVMPPSKKSGTSAPPTDGNVHKNSRKVNEASSSNYGATDSRSRRTCFYDNVTLYNHARTYFTKP